MMKNKLAGTEDTVIEEREDFMLSSVARETHPTLRTAHFLKNGFIGLINLNQSMNLCGRKLVSLMLL